VPEISISAADIKSIYSRLQDDESRFIFKCRLMRYISDSNAYLDKMIRNANQYSDKWKTPRDLAGKPELDGAECILYGAGYYSKLALDMLGEYGIKAIAFCDRKPGIKNHFGLPVIAPDSLPEHKDKYILIASVVYRDEIYELLTEMRFPEERILSIGKFDEQYFDNDFLRPLPDEVYVDAGCYDGYSIERFVKFTGGAYKKIFGLEPSIQHFNDTAQHIKRLNIQKVELINRAAWSENTDIDFVHWGEGSRAYIGGSDTVKAATIDSIVNGEDVTFIKMDIEGAEVNGLTGARQTILRCKPRLAVCVYHKPEDILTIPAYIHSILPEYIFYLRHHECDNRYYETVLYAVI